MAIKRRLTLEERRERRRRAVQKSKFALPSAITLTSVLCGFSSVVMALDALGGQSTQSLFILSAVLLLAAAVFDMFDGMVARATNTATEFGVQLDSLADVVSFGMAPAILAYKYGFYRLGVADPQIRAIGWAASFFFLACGALRLARFNVQVGHVDSRFFVGMPIPAGAAWVASVVLFFPGSPTELWHAYLFAGLLFGVGLMMISTIRFPSIKKLKAKGQALVYILATIVFLLSLLIIFRRHFFLGFFSTYTVAALLMNLGWLMGWNVIAPPEKSQGARSAEAPEEP